MAEYGRPSCVGCGRCISGCPAKIDIVSVIEKLRGEKDGSGRAKATARSAENPYKPELARIVRIHKMVRDNHLFQLRFVDPAVAEAWSHRPGQFVQLSVIGTGEAPISISSSPTRGGILELCVRKAGRVTGALYRMPTNALVGIRGPYGNGFPVEEMEGNDLLIVAGGLGMAPLRSLLWYALDQREKFGQVTLMYGARTPDDMLYRDELVSLADVEDVNVLLTVDRDPTGGFKQHVGLLPPSSRRSSSTPSGPTRRSSARRWSTSSSSPSCSGRTSPSRASS